MDTLAVVLAIVGGVTGLLSVLVGYVNMRGSQSHTIIERAEYLESQVTKLSEENDGLLNDKIALQTENARLRRMLGARQLKDRNQP